MKLFLILFLVLGGIYPAFASEHECLPSIKAVRAAHYPGVSVRWKEGCGYYAIERSYRHRKEVVQADSGKTSGRSKFDSRPRPALSLAGAAKPIQYQPETFAWMATLNSYHERWYVRGWR